MSSIYEALAASVFFSTNLRQETFPTYLEMEVEIARLPGCLIRDPIQPGQKFSTQILTLEDVGQIYLDDLAQHEGRFSHYHGWHIQPAQSNSAWAFES